MKRLNFAIIFFLVFIFLSCSKNTDENTIVPTSIVAKWILTEGLADPGDGSGKWTAVSKPNYYYLQLNLDSTARSNYYQGYPDNADLKEYKMPNDSTIIFVFKDKSTRMYHCRIDNKSLIIMGGCIEACGSKFIRSK